MLSPFHRLILISEIKARPRAIDPAQTASLLISCLVVEVLHFLSFVSKLKKLC